MFSVDSLAGFGPELADKSMRLRLFESAIGGTSNGVVITDAAATIVYVNPAFSRITGYAREHVIGRNMNMLHSGRQDEDFYRAMWQALRHDGRWEGAIWNRRRDGSVFHEWLAIDAVHGAGGEIAYYVGIFSDLSSLRDRERQFERHAFVDPLTGTANRLLFHELLVRAVTACTRRHECLAVVILDIDRFVAVNEELGLESGDRVLQEVAARLTDALRSMDVLARLGGDQYGVVAAGLANEAAAEALADKLRAAIAQPMDAVRQGLQLSASAGVSFFPDDGADAATLRSRAEVSMFRAKEAGGARSLCYSRLHRQSS